MQDELKHRRIVKQLQVECQELGDLTNQLEGRLNIPVRNKDEVALARPNDITVDEAFAIAFERYESALEELAKK